MTITPDNADTLIQALQWLKEDGEIECQFGSTWECFNEIDDQTFTHSIGFRRVQKPEECWRMHYNNCTETYDTEAKAQKYAEWAKRAGYSNVRIVHIREVKP